LTSRAQCRASRCRRLSPFWPSRCPRGPRRCVQSWEQNGSGGSCQVRSEGVTVPGWKPLTCTNVVQQRLCRVVRSVRIEMLSSPTRRPMVPKHPPPAANSGRARRKIDAYRVLRQAGRVRDWHGYRLARSCRVLIRPASGAFQDRRLWVYATRWTRSWLRTASADFVRAR
jgi:hypothetical protein